MQRTTFRRHTTQRIDSEVESNLSINICLSGRFSFFLLFSSPNCLPLPKSSLRCTSTISQPLLPQHSVRCVITVFSIISLIETSELVNEAQKRGLRYISLLFHFTHILLLGGYAVQFRKATIVYTTIETKRQLSLLRNQLLPV